MSKDGMVARVKAAVDAKTDKGLREERASVAALPG